MWCSVHQRGFSLIEILVVISIIGLIAGIAIPQISSFRQAATEAKAMRNAQNLAAVSSQAKAVGIDFVGSNSRAQAISNVISGATPVDGSFAGDYFGVPNMTPSEAVIASVYLKIQDSALQYLPEGGQSPISSLPPANQ